MIIRGEKGRFLSHGNTYKEDENYIYCYDCKGELLFYTDIKNKGIIKARSWCKFGNGYSATFIKDFPRTIGRYLTKAGDNERVTYIEGNKRNNTLSNLEGRKRRVL